MTIIPWKCRAKYWGRKDGKTGLLPDELTGLTFFEDGIKDAQEEGIQDIYSEWKKGEESLKINEQTLEERLDEKQTRIHEFVDVLKREHGGVLPELKLTPALYWLIVVLIGLSEMAVNSVVFAIFRETQFFTLLMALSVVVGLPASGHLIGVALGGRERRPGLVAGAAFLVAASFFALFWFAVARRDYLAATTPAEISSSVAVWTFVALNGVLFAVVSVASYLYHGDALRLYKMEKTLSRIQEQLDRTRRERAEGFEVAKGRVQRLREAYEYIVSLYRHYYVLKSKGNNPFKGVPAIDVPPEFKGYETT